mmetsp:Transcript_99551/g.197306  ORF Transcript_99551/g.197306 Transcript_99551/m.197306 type:complete len:208 (+) Transcript_99551:1728-2351(+)
MAYLIYLGKPPGPPSFPGFADHSAYVAKVSRVTSLLCSLYSSPRITLNTEIDIKIIAIVMTTTSVERRQTMKFKMGVATCVWIRGCFSLPASCKYSHSASETMSQLVSRFRADDLCAWTGNQKIFVRAEMSLLAGKCSYNGIWSSIDKAVEPSVAPQPHQNKQESMHFSQHLSAEQHAEPSNCSTPNNLFIQGPLQKHKKMQQFLYS